MRGLLLLTLAAVVACGGTSDTNEPGVAALPTGSSGGVPGLCGRATTKIRATVETEAMFVPVTTVHDRRACVLDLSGQAVTVSSIQYGALTDCTNGAECQSSYVCTVFDETPLLLSALWYADDDTPATLKTNCPGFPDGATWTAPHCSPAGMAHPVTETEMFAALVTGAVGDGMFRHCFHGIEDRF